MACVIIVKNKKSGNEYAYQSVSYRDPVTKKPRNKRTYLGRVDPISREIIPPKKEGRKNFTKSKQLKNDDKKSDIKNIPKHTASTENNSERILSLEIKVNQLNTEINRYKNVISSISSIINDLEK